MINQIDDTLAKWIRSLAGGREPTFGMPCGPEGDLTIHVHLMELCDDALRHNTSRPAVQPSLRYLVTTSCSDMRQAHELLGDLLFFALKKPNLLGDLLNSVIKNPEFEVEFEPASSPVWTALQLPPRPAFVIRVPLSHEWPPLRSYLVKDVSLGQYEIVWLYGLVLGPDDIPLVQARIDVKNLNKYTYTDRTGHFAVAGVPAAPSKKTLIITARGCEVGFPCVETGTIDDPQIFHFEIPTLPKE